MGSGGMGMRRIGTMARAAMLVVACAATGAFGSPHALAPAAGTEVRVRLQNPTGGTITKGFVVIAHEWIEHENEGVEEHQRDEMMKVPFDRTADFVISVKPGFYNVYASAYGYDPKCMKIHVADGKNRALVFQLVENNWIYTPMVE